MKDAASIPQVRCPTAKLLPRDNKKRKWATVKGSIRELTWGRFSHSIIRPVSVSQGTDPSAVGECRRAQPGTVADPIGAGAAEVMDPTFLI